MNTFLAAFLGCALAMLVVDVARVQIMTALVRRATKRGHVIVPPGIVPCERCKRTQIIPSDLTVEQAAEFLGAAGWRVYPLARPDELAQMDHDVQHKTIRVCPFCALALDAEHDDAAAPDDAAHEDLTQ